MGLEVVVNINDFVTTNPTGSDPKSAGDDHLRYIKTALKNDFAGFTGAVLVTGVDGGAADVYTLTPAHALVAYTTRMLVEFKPTATNTTTTPTLNISGLGAKTIKSVADAALVAGDLVISTPTLLAYDGTNLRLLGPTKAYVDAVRDYATQLAFATALPAQSLGFVRSDGTTAAFTQTHTGYAQKEVKGADIASAATINLTTATGNLVHITGSTGPVTAFTIPSGAEYTVVWDSTPTITHNATTLILPSGENITVAAGDVWKVRGDGTDQARVVGVEKANGQPIKGGLTLLATLTPTAAANVDALSTFTSTYDNYVILVDGVKPAADDTLRARFAVAGSVDAGSNYYGANHVANATTAGTDLWSGTGSATTSAGKGVSYALAILNANDATNGKVYSATGRTQSAATPTYAHTELSGMYVAANAISGIRFYWAAGNNFSATGKIRIYGYNNS